LPSISPAWIPLRTRTTGSPRAADAAGVKAPEVETIATVISRPAAERPNRSRRSAGHRAASRTRKSPVSASDGVAA